METKLPVKGGAIDDTTSQTSATVPATNNFFDYAPRELTHSSYWAWVLGHSNMPDTDEGKLALSFLKHTRITGERIEEVKREVSVPTPTGNGTNRFDIVVCFESGNCLIIENKIRAGLNEDQLSRYENIPSIDIPNTRKYTVKYRVFLNSGYDLGYTAHITNHLKLTKWTCVCADDIKRMLNSLGKNKSQLTNDYSNWINDRFDEWREIRDGLDSHDKDIFSRSIENPVGQYEILQKSLGALNGFIKHGNHRGGLSYVNFTFYGVNNGKWILWGTSDLPKYRAVLFYRVEHRHIRLGQYLEESDLKDQTQWGDTLKEKMAMRNVLRQHFDDTLLSLTNCKFDLCSRNRCNGKKSSTIALFKLSDAGHKRTLIKYLPVFHKEFLKRLRNDKWPGIHFCTDKCV